MIAVRGRADLVEALARRRDVAWIEANAPIRSRMPLPETVTPGAGLGIESVAGSRLGPGPNIAKIGAPDVWAAGLHGQGVVIAGADTGYVGPSRAASALPRLGRHDGDHNYNWHDAIHDAAAAIRCGSNRRRPATTTATARTRWAPWSATTAPGNQIGVAPGANGSAAATWTEASERRRATRSASSSCSRRPTSRRQPGSARRRT